MKFKFLRSIARSIARAAVRVVLFPTILAAGAMAKTAQLATVAAQMGFSRWVTNPTTGQTALFDNESIMQQIATSLESISNKIFAFTLGPLATVGNDEAETFTGNKKKNRPFKKLSEKEQKFWDKIKKWHEETIELIKLERNKYENHDKSKNFDQCAKILDQCAEILKTKKQGLKNLINNNEFKLKIVQRERASIFLEPLMSYMNAAELSLRKKSGEVGTILENLGKANNSPSQNTDQLEQQTHLQKKSGTPGRAPGPPLQGAGINSSQQNNGSSVSA